tara:strand:- start:2709 stop:3542 length:834 start_codon:yes stop_codon:yes gene_type:complete
MGRAKKYKRILDDREHSLKNPDIKFTVRKDFAHYVDLAPVQPAKEFVPAWYKNLQREWSEMRDGSKGLTDESWNTVPYKDNSIKKCPTVKDIMFEGYIIPLWLDLKISFTKETGFNWYNKHAHEETITYHSPHSIGSMPINEGSWNTAMKFDNPWDIVTPPGWSVLITSPWYHRHWEIEIMPSIVETDSYHQMNIPFLYHGKGEKIFRQGMPLIQVIPFKRNGFGTLDNYECRVMDEGDMQYYDKSRKAERTKQNGWYRWLTQQNKRIWKKEGIIDE